MYLHHPLSFLDILIFEAVSDFRSHDFFYGSDLWISALRNCSDRKITVSEHSYKAVAVAHGRTPTSNERICLAASWTESSGEMTSTYCVMMSLSCIFGIRLI